MSEQLSKTELSQKATQEDIARQFKNAQESVIKSLMQYVKGEGPLYVVLSKEEEGLLKRMSAEVRKAMRENPDGGSLQINMQSPEVYLTWATLVNRLSQDRVGATPSVEATEKPLDKNLFNPAIHGLALLKQLNSPDFQQKARKLYPEEMGKLPFGHLVDMVFTGTTDKGYEAYKNIFEFVKRVSKMYG